MLLSMTDIQCHILRDYVYSYGSYGNVLQHCDLFELALSPSVALMNAGFNTFLMCSVGAGWN